MKITSVLIETEDKIENAVYGSSALMLEERYVIATANLFIKDLERDLKKKFQLDSLGLLYQPNEGSNTSTTFNVIWKTDSRTHVKVARILAAFTNESIKQDSREVLREWTVDSPNNRQDVSAVLGIFFVLKVDESCDLLDFKNCLNTWWNLVKNEDLKQTDELWIHSTPFGFRSLLNSCSRGICSNVVGRKASLIVSDCLVTPGSEGSLVFKMKSELQVPIGIVISSSCWWKSEWTSLTLIADVRSILKELLFSSLHTNSGPKIPHHRLLASVESSFVQIYSGSNWGTATIISVDDGLLLTNSHVIKERSTINLYWRGQSTKADLLYRTPDDEVFDLAVLRCDSKFLKRNKMEQCRPAKAICNIGDQVYAVGFALFGKDAEVNPSVCKGFVSQVAKSVIRTTCCVNPGMSGGAIVNGIGEIFGFIVCNTKLENDGLVYPRFNMAIPYDAIAGIIESFVKRYELSILKKLHTFDKELTLPWKNLGAKL